GPDVLTKISSGDIKAKEGDLVNLLCSAQGELPITFSWEKDQKPLESFMEKEKPHRSSFLVVTVKDQSSFGKYICHIRDRFQSTSHTIRVQKLEGAGNFAF
ncbi:fasciclin-2-like isoform X2, partial [Paramuricea clavata]